MALSCGENGIELYLHPERGDASVFVDDADSYLAALNFALTNPAVKSIVVDGINLAFADWMSSWEDELKVEELKGPHWRKVKGPWREVHRRVMNSPKNFGCSAWPKGVKYVQETQEAKMPGAEPKKNLVILEQDAPHVEAMIPFAVDMCLKTEIELNKKFAPTAIHRITYMGGRRPASIPASELHTGKFWRFDSSKVDEISPFDKVLKPIIEKWQDGAIEYVGLNPKEGEREVTAAKVAYEDQVVGAVLAGFKEATTMDGLVKVWNESEAARLELPPNKRDIINAAKNARKGELA
jgi:hypothetical protein